MLKDQSAVKNRPREKAGRVEEQPPAALFRHGRSGMDSRTQLHALEFKVKDSDKSGSGRSLMSERSSVGSSLDKIRFAESWDRVQQPRRAIQRKLREFDVMDETIKLYQCMPKGLEYFIATGPPKQVHDHCDYVKMCQQHERLVTELSLQEDPRRHRWRALAEKQLKLKEAMMKFDHFLQDMERKEARSKQQFLALFKERMNLQDAIPQLIGQLALLKMEKTRIGNRLRRYDGMVQFMEAVLKNSEGHFRSFSEVMDRHETLLCTFGKQLNKYTRGMETLEKAKDLYEEMCAENAEQMLHLRTTVRAKLLERDRLYNENQGLRETVHYHQRQAIHRDVYRAGMKAAIDNMVNFLMDYRPFTRGRLYNSETDEQNLEAIGDLINDYGVLLSKLQDQLSADKARQKEKKDSEETNIFSVPPGDTS